MSTLTSAEHMLATGKHYTASLLAAELGLSAIEASGHLFNIRNGKKYQCDVTQLPNRTVKVCAINGKSIPKKALWDLALFNRPIAKDCK